MRWWVAAAVMARTPTPSAMSSPGHSGQPGRIQVAPAASQTQGQTKTVQWKRA